MSKILLAQPKLPDSSWIDLTVGEPYIIKDNLLKLIDIKSCMPVMNSEDFIYPSPCGDPNLVKYLEDKHGYPVIITNGAKQALGAAFYAVKQLGINDLGLRTPFWALMPPLADLHGLNIVFHDRDNIQKAELCIAPNNPDGFIGDLDEYEERCKQNNSILIHDAAYYTGHYTSIHKKMIGDVQIYSCSKMFGLSSLRLGYAVCRNVEMYEYMQYYMEHMTVGVSKMPQMFLLNVFKSINMNWFETQCHAALSKNKSIANMIDTDIISIQNIDNSMFLWGELLNKKVFESAKLHIIDGECFGNKDYIRINMGFDEYKMQEIVRRLNRALHE